MRGICALLLLLVVVGCTQPADAQISVGINAPGITIGINLPVFPNLVVVPGYPVYYAPSVTADYFFYDGFYWVFNVADGQWYSSSWYNGPWVFVDPVYVPQPLLVIPLRYYRVRPTYWGGWAFDAPPQWGQHWGHTWESRRAGWDRWDRSHAPAAAPLPVYQKDYPRDKYPVPSQQVTIHNERYTYQSQDTHVQRERAAIYRQESSGGSRATVKAERAAQATSRSPRPEALPPPAAPRQQGPAVERAQPPRGGTPAPQRVEPQPNAPRQQTPAPQAPHGERPPAQQPPAQQHPGPQQPPERGPEGHPDEGRK